MDQVSKETVNYRPADGDRCCGNCVMFRVSQSASAIRLTGYCDLVAGEIYAGDVCDRWEGSMEKSAKTPELSSTHNPLGQEGLWRTPSKKVPEKQQLPAYHQNIAHALMRSGMSESAAIATAINATKRWASGKGKVHPEVVAASRVALAEWNALRASHE